MPKQINAGRVTSALQRAFGFKGKYTPMLDEVIVPVYTISDPTPALPQRLAFATVTSPGILDTTLTAPAATLTNPKGSGIIVSLTSLNVGLEEGGPAPGIVALTILVRFIGGSSFGLPGNVYFRDQRIQQPQLPIGGQIRPIAQVNQIDDTYPLVTDPFAQIIAKADESLRELAGGAAIGQRQPLLVLPEDRGIQIIFAKAPLPADTNDVSLIVNLGWLEVPISETIPAGGLP